MEAIWASRDVFLHGLLNTVLLVLISGLLAFLLGVCIAIMRMSPLVNLRILGAVYVAIFRNTPSVVLFFMAVFVLPKFGFDLTFFQSGVIALTAYYAAYFCETVRSGIATVPFGQIEAARSIGLRFSQILSGVIVPQALRSMVPALINVEIAVIRTSAIAGAFGVVELFASAKIFAADHEDVVLLVLTVAGAMYLALTLVAGTAARMIERRVAFKR